MRSETGYRPHRHLHASVKRIRRYPANTQQVAGNENYNPYHAFGGGFGRGRLTCGSLGISAEKELTTAIRDVMAGRTYVTSMVTGDVLGLLMKAKETPSEDGIALSSRQREVLQLIAEGRTMKEVATILDISQRTAESHKYDMMETLGVKT